MILKLGMHHLGLKLYRVYINDDPGLTMNSDKAKCGRLCILMEKTVTKYLNGQYSFLAMRVI